MIDLHCHLLPGIDDGAPDLDTALAMARIAVADGIEVLACTPHVTPGVYDNDGAGISAACEEMRLALAREGIGLELTFGADARVSPELLGQLASGSVPTLHGSRYFLFEPSHHVPLPGLAAFIARVIERGYVPVITHPERLRYIRSHYEEFLDAAAIGAWIQLTAGSLVGRFGSGVKEVADRFLADGVVHLLATDAHNTGNRAPLLAEGREAAAQVLGEEEAGRLVALRPRAVLDDRPPAQVPAPPSLA